MDLLSTIDRVKAGRTYIPVDKALPLERMMRMIANSKSKLILSPPVLPSEMNPNGKVNRKKLSEELQ